MTDARPADAGPDAPRDDGAGLTPYAKAHLRLLLIDRRWKAWAHRTGFAHRSPLLYRVLEAHSRRDLGEVFHRLQRFQYLVHGSQRRIR